MFITFLVSSVFHELVMSCITKKLRGYGFLAMMLQMPIVAVQRSRFFRGKRTLNVRLLSSLNHGILIGLLTAFFTCAERLLLAIDDNGAVYGEFYTFPAG